MKQACKNLAQASSYSSWDYTTTERGYAGYAGGVRYDATILRFDVPSLPSPFKSLDIGIVVSSGVGSDVKLRYAVCTSDANRAEYVSTTGAVSDANQIADGTIAIGEVSSAAAKMEFSIDVDLAGGKTYYLILWAFEQTGVFVNAASSGHSATVVYNGGVVRLKANGQAKPHMALAKVSGSLKQTIPYVKTASGIKPCG